MRKKGSKGSCSKVKQLAENHMPKADFGRFMLLVRLFFKVHVQTRVKEAATDSRFGRRKPTEIQLEV